MNNKCLLFATLLFLSNSAIAMDIGSDDEINRIEASTRTTIESGMAALKKEYAEMLNDPQSLIYPAGIREETMYASRKAAIERKAKEVAETRKGLARNRYAFIAGDLVLHLLDHGRPAVGGNDLHKQTVLTQAHEDMEYVIKLYQIIDLEQKKRDEEEQRRFSCKRSCDESTSSSSKQPAKKRRTE